MKIQTSKTLLAVLALALGLVGPAAAQTSSEAQRVRPQSPRAQAPRTQDPSARVKVTETPATEEPTADSQSAQTMPSQPTGTTGTMGTTAGSTGSSVREEMAVSTARDWLALVDSGRFPESYDQAGELFRGSLPRDQWAAALGNSRKPLGNLGQRNLKTVVVAMDLPNAPKGKYVVSTFETSFQQQPQPMWEILTSYLNANGQWQVVGYQVKPHDAAAQGQQGTQGQQQQQQATPPPPQQ
jgi:hypothetical protein